MRRRLIVLSFLAVCVVAVSATGSAHLASAASAVVPAMRELNESEQIAHVLSRLTFGARPGDVARVQAMGVDRWIDRQLHPDRIDDAATDQFLSRYETLALSSAALYERFPPAAVLRNVARRDSMQRSGHMTRTDSMELLQQARRSNQFVAELTSSRVARAVMSERQLQEVMVDFWENHFTVFAGKGQTRWYLTSYDRDVIRPNALGSFRTLLGAVAKSPAMLFYLDNAQSVADSSRARLRAARPRARGLNENYARELMELHTLGVDGGYTQTDVIEVARALTGWSVRPPRQLRQLARDPRVRRIAERVPDDGRAGEFVFRPETHDAEAKLVLGHKLKAGRGIEDGEDVLDILARHPATAKFIARKLAVRFVSDEPPQAVVDRAAATFTRTKGDIREVVRTIVTSPEFFSRAAFRSKVKSPFEVVTSTLRALDAAPDATPRSAQLVARLGQPIFGHQAPNGYPETSEPWMNTGTILSRINFGMAAAANRLPGVQLDRWPEASRLRSMPRPEQVDGVVASLLGGHASAQTREILTTGVHPMVARVAADSAASMVTASDSTPDADPTMTPDEIPARRRQRLAGQGFGNVPELTGLAQVVGLALGSPEFQRR
ncbi:MAG TPA: DUF1800 domain-containing protein [Gemmatimonadaceae bacterium]|nr:DUF1800 domain-containing protein [Gemmatimonadaceae bacterium]